MDVRLKNELITSSKGTVSIFSADYRGEACFAIVHKQSGFTTVFGNEKRIYNAIVRMQKKGYSISKEYDCARMPRFRLVKHDGDMPRIDLRKFLYARYNKIPLDKIRGVVYVHEDRRAQDNVLDLRRNNLYVPGESIENSKGAFVSIIQRPGYSDEKYIAITFEKDGKGLTEITTYTPELYEMLSCPSYCKIGINHRRDRLMVYIHYAPGGYCRDNLSRFLTVYKHHFNKYQKMRGNVKRFIKDYKKLSGLHDCEDAAHINADTTNDCFENLLFMNTKVNIEMRDYIRWFSQPYSVYTTANSMGEVLIEFAGNQYYRCPTPEDYADWQKVFLGKVLTQKLQAVTYATPDVLTQELTPRGMIVTGKVNKETARDNAPGIWDWMEHRDMLLARDEWADKFTTWKAGAWRTISGAKLPDDLAPGASVVIPWETGFALITRIEKANKK